MYNIHFFVTSILVVTQNEYTRQNTKWVYSLQKKKKLPFLCNEFIRHDTKRVYSSLHKKIAISSWRVYSSLHKTNILVVAQKNCRSFVTSILVIRRKLKWKYTYRTRCTERQHRYPEVSATRSTRGRETWCTRKPREDAPDARSSHVCASEVWPDAEAVPLGRFVAGWSDFGRTGSAFASGGSRPSENARWSSMSFDVDRSRRRLRRGDYFFYYFSRIYLKLGHRYCILLCDTALDNRLSTNSVFRRQVEGAARNLSISIIANFFFRPQASFEFRISHLDFVTFDALNITGDVAKPCLKYYVRVYFSFLFFFFFFW